METISYAALTKRYAIGEELGAGSFGVVFRAVDHNNRDEPVVLKFVDSTGRLSESMREYLLAQQVKSPYVVRYRGMLAIRPAVTVGEDQKLCDMVVIMDSIDGEDLFNYIVGTLRGAPAHERLLAFMQFAHDLFEGLTTMHRTVVHQDIKPENVMVTNQNGASGIKAIFVDFGLSCNVRDGGDTTYICKRTGLRGTRSYQSPDRARLGLRRATSADPKKNDVYAVGEMLLDTALGDIIKLCSGSKEQCWEIVASQARVLPAIERVNVGNARVNDLVKAFLRRVLAGTDAARPTAAEALRLFRRLDKDIGADV